MPEKRAVPQDQPPSSDCPVANAAESLTRRSFLGQAGAAMLVSGVSAGPAAPSIATKRQAISASSALLDIMRLPDRVNAYAQLTEAIPLERETSEWRGQGIEIETLVKADELSVRVHSPGLSVRFVHLRWNLSVNAKLLVLGDHWERSYGDLGWRSLVPERVMPWYFATWDGARCNGYGVKTGPGSLCFWQLDPDGASLWLNLSNGGSGVNLAQRVLDAVSVVVRQGSAGETATAALRSFCNKMCSKTSRPPQQVYGTNDWYYAYGNNTAKRILEDTDFIAELSAGNAVRPFSVIDMGWAVGAPKFPSMPELASQIRQRRVRPGIWIRPLEASADTTVSLLMPDRRFGDRQERARELAYDPTVPEAMERILAKVKQLVGWGFELVKHDFSTYDLLGRWGFEMGAEPTAPGWSLADSTRTNAEIISDLYHRIREVCGVRTVILGCNTVGHLAQGYFDIQRTGDDTSGRIWERTRRMGVNTLAFRLPQHGAFFVQDADCVGISEAVPWEANRQWLDLLARSGTALFVSPGEGSRSPDHANAIKEAFQIAASGGDGAYPLEPFHDSTPRDWMPAAQKDSAHAGRLHYDWCSPTGAYPFAI